MILGDASKSLVKQIEEDINSLKEKKDNRKIAKETLNYKIKTKGETFTVIARTISALITGGAGIAYRKDYAEKDFATIAEKEILDAAE